MIFKLTTTIVALVATTAVSVNGQKYVSGVAASPSPNAKTISDYNLPHNALQLVPISDLNSKALTCRSSLNYQDPAIKSYPSTAGEMMVLKWDMPDVKAAASNGKGNITGPCAVYMATMPDKGKGPEWFKIQETGYDAKAGWCTDKLRKDKNMVVSVPKNLAKGDYLIRTEVIDLTFADKTFAEDPSKGAQIYSDCMKTTIADSTGKVVPKDGLVKFPDAYTMNNPGLLVALDKDGKPPKGTYKYPGPSVFDQNATQ